LDTQRLSYLFNRNTQELTMLIRELWSELRESRFKPIGFEVAFGDGCEMGAIPINGSRMQAQLRGFVDRIDAWQEDGRNYFRVVDYKTGKKDFDYCDVFNGLGLQMLLYLFALQDEGALLLGDNPIPAGVQYFPARVPIVASDGVLSAEEADNAREKAWKRKGLLLADNDVLWAMEPQEKMKRLSASIKKDGTLGGDVASREQFELLKKYVFKVLEQMVDEIASGSIVANPYTRGSKHNPCVYCPYTSVCHPQDLSQRRDYAAMTASRFWEEIGKELNTNG
jgi:ATP-dependent helicase/nuclease subunit B